jgi:N-formylglutamate deformylase
VFEHLRALGYEVKINDPFKGVELVRAYADPSRERHSLQLEINKRIYMDGSTGAKLPHFMVLQQQLMGLLAAIQRRFG